MFDLSKLNDSQRAAVTHTDGPMMILAGAGSGKTRTLVSKISYLLDEKHISAHHILAMTFSNKAAKEMRSRVAAEVRRMEGTLKITTFHAFCSSLLRREASYIGLSKSFSIYDSSESLTIVKVLLRKKGISTRELDPYEITHFIETLHNAGYYWGRENVVSEDKLDIDLEEFKQDPLWPFYCEYETELLKANALDFGRLITAVIQLFEQHPDVLQNYQSRFRYILVDEYQDTNRAQFILLNLLSAEHKNICVVGDEDQSIYSWRGANIFNILDFEKLYPGATLLKLEQNYRSSKNIIEAAGHVIARNSMRKGKKMWTDNQSGEAIDIVELNDDRAEALFIAKKIKELKEQGEEYSDMSVFYRTNAQSRQIEDAMRGLNIPYRVVGGIRFYERKEVKDLLAYLRLVTNFKDNLAFSRIINVPARGIGTTSLKKIEDIAVQEGISLWETCVDIVENPAKYKGIRLSAKIKSSLLQFTTLIGEGQLLAEHNEKPSIIYDKILNESGYYDFLKSKKDFESIARVEHLDELGNALVQFEQAHESPSLQGFLETITLDANNDDEEDEGEVCLMTIHGAKGLEFPYVFIAGAEENIFPSVRSFDSPESIEEERRLFYVAMTRAMKKLYVTCCTKRMLYGQMQFHPPSRFIYEIPNDYYQWNTIKSEGHTFSSQYHNGLDNDDFNQDVGWDEDEVVEVISSYKKFAEGKRVKHSLYGEGVIIRNWDSNTNEKVSIKFNNGEQKTFVTDKAPLTVIE